MNLLAMGTRQLMALRRRAFKRATCGCPSHCGDEALSEQELQFNNDQRALLKQVNEVLATREHIPNKKEGKAMRRFAAGVRR